MADADLNQAIRSGVNRRHPEGFVDLPIPDGTSDSEVLRIAADSGCVLVSHDVSTMRPQFEAFIAHRDSPGLILIPQFRPVRDAIEMLLLHLQTSASSDFLNRIGYL